MHIQYRQLLYPVIMLVVFLYLPESPSIASKETARPELVFQFSQLDEYTSASFASHAPVMAVSDRSGHIDIYNTRNWALERHLDAKIGGYSCSYFSKVNALSPDGNTLAYMTGDGKVMLWNTRTGALIRTFTEAVGMPVCVTWSTDGSKIAAGGDKTVHIWDVASAKLRRTFKDSGDVTFSADGKIIGIANEDRAAIYDIDTGREIRSFKDKAGVRWPIAISPDKKLVATGGEDPGWHLDTNTGLTEAAYTHELKVKIWDLHTGKLIKMLPSHNNLSGGTLFLKFTADSRSIFASGEGSITLWDIKSRRKIKQFETVDLSKITTDGNIVQIIKKTLEIYDVKSGKRLLKLHAKPLPIISIAFSGDGNTLAAGDELSFTTGLRLWNLQHGKLSYALPGPPPNLHDVNFLPNHRVVSNSLNGNYIWDSNTGKLLAKQKKYAGSFSLLTPDGSKVVSQPNEAFKKTYIVRNAADGKTICRIDAGEYGSLGDAAFSPDGRLFASAGHELQQQILFVWNLESGEIVNQINAAKNCTIHNIQFSPNVNKLAYTLTRYDRESHNLNTDVMLWDINSNKAPVNLALWDDSTARFCYTSDGNMLITGHNDRIYMYDINTGQNTGSFDTGRSRITALAVSSDNKRLAIGYEDGSIQIWDFNTKKLMITMLGLPDPAGDRISKEWIAYTPDGYYYCSPGAAKLCRWRIDGRLHSEDAVTLKFKQSRLLK